MGSSTRRAVVGLAASAVLAGLAGPGLAAPAFAQGAGGTDVRDVVRGGAGGTDARERVTSVTDLSRARGLFGGAVGSLSGALPASVMPKDCYVSMANFDNTRKTITYRGVDAGKTFARTFFSGQGIVAQAGTEIIATRLADSTYRVRWLVVEADTGMLWRLETTIFITSPTVFTFSDQRKVKVEAGWGDVASMTSMGTDLYVVTKAGAFRRHPIKALRPGAATVIAAKGFAGLKGLANAGRWIVGQTAAKKDILGDFFVSTTTTGKLKEYYVPVANPTAFKHVTLKASGWGGFAYVTAGSCNESRPMRHLLGVMPNGDAYLYKDADWGDYSGTDIKKVGIVAKGWKPVYAD